MDFETRNNVTLDEYIHMIGLKTSVLLACSAALGAVIAGADDSTCRSLYDFGYKLGIAFQIQDDWLDSFGDEKVFGKKIGGDILNNKKTWLLIKCKELATQNGTLHKLEDLLAMNQTQARKKIEVVKDFYKDYGVDALAQQAVNSYYSEAIDSLKHSGFSPGQVSRMEEFASSLVHRNK
ncbi:MAG: polyprenyl synthetase family protein [Bacteroidales bacterium]|nr:polyprenyl synthetase family protein [Bacteroidales bacterium]